MKLICSLHLKKTVGISSPKYVQVDASLHHFNRRVLKNAPPDPPTFQGFLLFVTGTPEKPFSFQIPTYFPLLFSHNWHFCKTLQMSSMSNLT